MKKSLLVLSTTSLLCTSVFANSEISTIYSYKDYDNSKTKTTGKTVDYNFKQKINNIDIEINYEDTATKRENKVLNTNLQTLEVEKLALKASIKTKQKTKYKFSFLNIEDNLAVTDNGKIYSFGAMQMLNKSTILKGDFYFSDYEDFNVNQYDLNFIKKVDFDSVKASFISGIKIININGSKYGSYKFKKDDYKALNVGMNLKYNNMYLNANAIFGNRAFSVLNDGIKVQHHAMEQESLYAVKIGKKFKEFDLFAAYNFQKGKELPEQQNNVKTEVYSVGLSYKF